MAIIVYRGTKKCNAKFSEEECKNMLGYAGLISIPLHIAFCYPKTWDVYNSVLNEWHRHNDHWQIQTAFLDECIKHQIITTKEDDAVC